MISMPSSWESAELVWALRAIEGYAANYHGSTSDCRTPASPTTDRTGQRGSDDKHRWKVGKSCIDPQP